MPSMLEFYGNGLFKTLTGDITLKRGSHRVQVLDPNGTDRIVTLPDEEKLFLGGPQFYIINVSATNTIEIRQANALTIITLATEEAAVLGLIRATTNERWLAKRLDFAGTAVGKL